MVMVTLREIIFLVTSVICVLIRCRGPDVTTTLNKLSYRFSSTTAFLPEWIRSTVFTLFAT